MRVLWVGERGGGGGLAKAALHGALTKPGYAQSLWKDLNHFLIDLKCRYITNLNQLIIIIIIIIIII